jgi:phage-related protein
VASSVEGLRDKLRVLDRTSASPKVALNDRQLRAQAAAAEKRVADLNKRIEQDSPQLDLNIRAFEAKQEKVTADLNRLRGQKVTPEVEAKILKAQSQLATVDAELNRLRGKKVTPEVHVELTRATADLDAFNAKLARVDDRPVKTLDRSFGSAAIRMAGLTRAMSMFALPGAIVAATPYIASLGASAVQASGALWLLPAAAVAGGVAFGALKLGMSGFGEAMKNLDDPAKFAEAIAKLSPAARDAATTVRGLVPAWTAMKNTVQDNLFAGVSGQVSALAGIYLPMLRGGLGSVATSLNGAVIGLANWARQGSVIGSMQTIFTNVGNAMQALQPVGVAIASIFTDIAMVGSGFLPGLATGFANAATGAAAFIANARQTGQLAVWIGNGLAVLRQLGTLAMNVGSILGSIFGGAQRSGESFLAMLVRVTGTMASALKTPEGAAGVQQFFTTVRTVVGLLWDKLVQLWPAIVAAGSAFGALLVAAAPLSNMLFGLVVTVLTPLLNLIGAIAPILGPVLVVMGAMRVAVAAWTAVQWLLNVALSANPIGLVIIAITALVAGLIWAWNSSETFRNVVLTVWGAIKTAAVAVFGFITNFIVGTWNNIVTSAVAAWGFISGFFVGTWNNIRNTVAVVWGWIVGFIQGSLLVLQAVWTTVWNAVVAVFSAIWNTIQSVATTVWGAIQAYFTASFAVFSAIFSAIWNGISAVFSAVWNFIRSVAMTVWGAIQAYFAASFAIFQAIFSAVWNAVSAVFTAVWNFIRNTAVTVWNAISAFFAGAFAAYQAFFAAVWNAVSTVFTTVWNFIRNTAVTIWTAISAFFGAAFAAFQAFFAAVWNAISLVFTTVWNFIRNTAITIWNAIYAFFSAAFAVFTAFFSTIWNNILAFFTNTWNFLRNVAVTAWNTIYAFFQGAFAVFSGFFANVWNNIVATFDRIWSGITGIAQRVWDNVSRVFKDSINWIIDRINDFLGVVNKIAGVLGFNIDLRINRLGDGGPVKTGPVTASSTAAGLAAGGPVNAANGGKLPYTGVGRDTLPAMAGGQPYMLMGDEWVIRRSSSMALGSAQMSAINNADKRPVDVIPRAKGGPVASRATGGPVVAPRAAERHGAFLNALADGQAEAVGAANAQGGVDRMLARLNAGHTAARRASGGQRATMPGYRDRTLEVIRRDLGGAIAFAKSMSGRPYIWGGTTTAGTDCSGYQGMITSVLRNQPPRRIGTTATFPWGGFTPGLTSRYAVGAFKGNPGHMAGTLDGVNVESGGSPSRVKYGAGAAGADHRQFSIKASLPEVGGVFASGGGGGGFILAAVRAFLDPIHREFSDIRNNPATPMGGRFISGSGVKIIDDIYQWVGARDTGGDGMDVSGISGPVVDQVRQVAARFGWDREPFWGAIMRLVQKESGWNPGAANPTSSARGLFQKMTSIHGGVEPTPAGQAAWGLNYIRGRYGDPVRALQFHNANNHYDEGGLARGTGILHKDVITPERVLSGRQTVAFERLVAGLTAGRPQARLAELDALAAAQGVRRGFAPAAATGGGGDVHIGTVLTPPGTTANQMAGAIRRELRVAKHGGRYR